MTSPLRNWSLRNRLTAGVLVLSAIGFVGAGLVAQSALRGYLIGQVDNQLLSVIGGTSARVGQAGIVNDEQVNPRHVESDEEDARPLNAPITPLNRVPTTVSVTLLDASGNLVGGIGGDLNANRITDYVVGWLPADIAKFGDKPFTVKTPGADLTPNTLSFNPYE